MVCFLPVHGPVSDSMKMALKSAVAIAKTLGVEIPWDTKVAAFAKSSEPMQGIA